VPHIRTPIEIGESVRVRTVAPKLGQHNAEIFGRLGVNEAKINRLGEKGVCCNRVPSSGERRHSWSRHGTAGEAPGHANTVRWCR
jgi:hypothetical protein